MATKESWQQNSHGSKRIMEVKEAIKYSVSNVIQLYALLYHITEIKTIHVTFHCEQDPKKVEWGDNTYYTEYVTYMAVTCTNYKPYNVVAGDETQCCKTAIEALKKNIEDNYQKALKIGRLPGKSI
jgi:hypothetical protein